MKLRWSASLRASAVVVLGITATFLLARSATALMLRFARTRKLPPSTKVMRLKSTCSDRAQGLGGRAALQIDGAVGDHLEIRVVGADRHPVDLQIGQLELLLDAPGHAAAQIDGVADGLLLGTQEGEGNGGLAVADDDGLRVAGSSSACPGVPARRRGWRADTVSAARISDLLIRASWGEVSAE